MTGQHRQCVTCRQTLTVPANNPRKRFCSPACRVADWHAHHDRPPEDDPDRSRFPNPPPDRAKQPATTNAVPAHWYGVPAANGVQHCPHCHRELAVIAVLAPAAAAAVTTPEVSHMRID